MTTRTDTALRERPTASAASLRHELAGLTEAAQTSLLLNLVRSHTAILLGGTGPETVENDCGFLDMGLSSRSAVELRSRLSDATGLRLPATLAFDYPTPFDLAGHLRSELTAAPGRDRGRAAPGPAALRLTEADAGGSRPGDGAGRSIDDMSTESLVQLALGGPSFLLDHE